MRYSYQEWLDEGRRRFGNNFEDWKFVCPACGRINTSREFKEAGATPDDMYLTCIGRHNGKGVKGIALKKGAPIPDHGCDWAAFGLLGTLSKGNMVLMENAKVIAVFPFAE